MSARVAVVGLGTMGSQVLWQLSRSGVDTTGFELHAPGHPYGAAGGETRLYRNVEIQDLRYLPIVDRADELWRDLVTASARPLRELTGSLVMGHADSTGMQIALRSVEAAGREFEVLGRNEAASRFPEFCLDEDELTIWDAGGGIIRPELTVFTATQLAEKLGARVHRATEVHEISQSGDTVAIRSERGTDHFDRVVVTAGAWTNKLLPELSDTLEMRSLISMWFFPEDAAGLQSVLPFVHTDPGYCYGLPVADRTSMKLGVAAVDDDIGKRVVDHPGSTDVTVGEAELAGFREKGLRLMPGLSRHPMRTEVYFESFTATDREIISQHPEMSGVVVMAGFSGHGFKMAPAIGEIGAQLAVEGETTLQVGFLDSIAAEGSGLE